MMFIQKLNSLYKVLIFFNEVSYELLNKSYPVLSINFNKYVENRNGLYFSDEEPMNVHSLNTLTDLIFKSIYPPFSLHIFKFEMSQNLDLSTIHLLHLEMVFNSTSTYPCVFPSTLTSLDLSIKTNAVSPETPILVLDNLHLEQLKIDGFKYDKTQCITMKVFPIKIKLNNCSNITITTTSNLSYEKTISTKEVSITQCSNISTITNTVLTILLLNLSDSNDILIETPNSILQSQNDVYVENIDEVNILDTNCINFKFVNTFTLRLTSISQFINIEYPYTLRLFEFNITPNHKNIELPLKENVIHPINSMDNLQLGCLKLTRIEEMNFFIQPTLYYIGLFNCTNIEIQSLGECIVDSFDFRGNRNCHFHDISLKNIVCSRSIYKQTGSGIKYVDVLLEDEYYPGSDDEDEYNEGELETLLEDVTIIGPHAFIHKGIRKITIPNTVKKLGDKVFQYCYWLNTIVFPSTLTSLGKYCFECCGLLTSITLPDSLVTIGDFCFNRCHSLKKITFPSSLTSIGNNIFEFCASLTSIHYKSAPQSLCIKTIPTHQIQHIALEQYKVLPSSTFEKFINLTSFELPTTLVEYDDYAFKNCSILTSITIPTSVTKIGKGCFQYCDNLHSIQLHQSLIIDKWCFNMKTALTSIMLPTTFTKLHKRFFYGCKSLQSIELPNTLQSIGKSCFNGCESLQSITIPLLIKTIPTLCFNECYKLSSISFGNVETIQPNAFQHCLSLTTLSLPTSLTTLQNDTFSYLHITSITLPPLITSLPDNCFYCCQFLTTITIPTTITSIGSYCFAYCFSLKTITLPTTITQQGDNIFYNCPLIN